MPSGRGDKDYGRKKLGSRREPRDAASNDVIGFFTGRTRDGEGLPRRLIVKKRKRGRALSPITQLYTVMDSFGASPRRRRLVGPRRSSGIID